MSEIEWGAPRLVITRDQQIRAAARVEAFLIAQANEADPDEIAVASDSGVTHFLTREDLVILIRATRGYYPDGGHP